MIKKLLLAIAVALPMCAAAQTPKFGIVEVEPIFQSLPETTAAQNQITEASKKYEDEFAKLQEEFNKKYTEFQNLTKDTTTPESIKERRMQELSELDQKVQQFRATATNDLQRQQQTHGPDTGKNPHRHQGCRPGKQLHLHIHQRSAGICGYRRG